MNEKIMTIKKYGKTARGQRELIKHLSGQRLTLKQAVNANCYFCMGFFADGKRDCDMPQCPLHPFMAYNENRQKRSVKRIYAVDEENMTAARL